MMGPVDGETARTRAARQRPFRLYLERAAVDDDHLTRVAFDIDVDRAGAVVDRELGFIRKGNGGKEREARSIEYRKILASAVEREHVFAGRFVQDRVGIVGGELRFLNDLERAQIEDRHRVRLAVARIAALQVLGEGDAVNSQGIGDAPEHRYGTRVDHIDARAMADEQPLTR